MGQWHRLVFFGFQPISPVGIIEVAIYLVWNLNQTFALPFPIMYQMLLPVIVVEVPMELLMGMSMLILMPMPMPKLFLIRVAFHSSPSHFVLNLGEKNAINPLKKWKWNFHWHVPLSANPANADAAKSCKFREKMKKNCHKSNDINNYLVHKITQMRGNTISSLFSMEKVLSEYSSIQFTIDDCFASDTIFNRRSRGNSQTEFDSKQFQM